MRAADVRAEEMDTAPPTRGGNGDAGKKYVEEALYLRLFRRGSTPQAVRLQLGGRRLHPPATAPGALPSGTQGGVTFRLGEPFLEKELAVQQAAKNPAPLAGSAACHGSASQVQMDGKVPAPVK